jgi:hypothetical protein
MQERVGATRQPIKACRLDDDIKTGSATRQHVLLLALCSL